MSGKLDFNVSFKTEQAARDFQTLFTEYINGSKRAGDMANQMLGGKVEKIVQVRLTKAPGGGQELQSITRDVRSEVDKLAVAYQKANAAQANSLTSVRQQLNQAKQARDSIAAFSSGAQISGVGGLFGKIPTQEFTLAQQKVADLTQQVRLLEASTGNAFDKFAAGIDFGGILRAGRGLTDIVAIFQSIGIVTGQLIAPITSASKALADLQGFALSFKAIGAGASGANQALSESRRIALGLGSSIITVREGFQKLAPVILSSGGNLGDVSKVVESLSSRFAAFGLNADQSRRVLNGVIQAFAKGKLQAEELTQQISEADPAFKIDLAKAAKTAGLSVNGTTAELEALVKAGKITAEQLTRLIPLISKSELLFGKLGSSGASAIAALEAGNVTITQVQANLGTLNQLNLEKFAKLAEPLVILFLRAQASVTDFITRILELEGTKSLIGIFNQIGGSVTRLAETLLSGVEAFARAISPILQFVNALLSIPGAAELAAIALLGKLTNPFRNKQDLFSKGLAGFILNPLRDLQKKADTVKLNGLFSGKTFGELDNFEKKVLAITDRTDKFKTNLESKVKAGVLGGLKSSTEQASAGLDGLARQAADTADSIVQADATATAAQQKNQKKLLADYTRKSKQKRDLVDRQASLESKIANVSPTGSTAGYERELTKIQQKLPKLNAELSNLRGSLKKAFSVKADTNTLDNQAKQYSGLGREVRGVQEITNRYFNDAIKQEIRAKIAADETIKSLREKQALLRKKLSDDKKFVADVGAQPPIGNEKLDKRRQKVLDATARGIPKLERELNSLTQAEKERTAQITENAKAGSRYTDGLNAQSSATERAAAVTARLQDENKALNNSTNLAQSGIKGLNRELSAINRQIKNIGDPTNSFKLLTREEQQRELRALTELKRQREELLGKKDLAVQQITTNVGAVQENERALKDLSSAQEEASRSTSKFGGIISGGFSGTLKAGKGLVGLLGKGFITLASEVGVLGIAFLAVGAAQSAYNKVTEQTRAIQEESKSKVQELKSALEELRGSTVEAEKPTTGLALAWERFGLLIKGIVDISGGVFNAITGGLSAFSGGTEASKKKWYDFVGSFAATVGTFAAGGAVIGAGLGTIFAPITATGGAVVGTIAGISVAIAGLGNGASVSQEKFKAALEATRQSTLEQSNAVGQLTAELARQVAEQDRLNAAKKAAENKGANGKGQTGAVFTPKQQEQLDNLTPKIQAAYTAALGGVRALEQRQAALNAQVDQYKSQLGSLPAATQGQVVQLGKLLAREKQINENRKKPGPKGNVDAYKQQEELKGIQAEIEALRSSIANTKGGAEAIDIVVNKLRPLTAEAAKVTDEFNKQKAALDRVAAATGNLTVEQAKTANTLTNLDEKLKTASAGLLSIDPDKNAAKWQQQNREVAKASVAYEELGNKASTLQSLYSALELIKGINLGTVVNSLSNAELVIQKLESARSGISIDSPGLPVLTQRLIEAQQRLDQLNGKRADVYVKLFQQGAANGSIPNTLSNINRLIEALRAKQANISVTSSGADAVASQIQGLERYSQLGAQTTSDLKIQLLEKEISKIDQVKAAKDRESQNALRNIDNQQRAIDRYYDSQISKLQELGPASKALAELERNRLRQQASKGGEEGLRARAQLERELAQEQIANIQKQKQADQDRLNAQREAIQLEQQKEDPAKLGLEQQLAALIAQRTAAEIAAINQIIQGRTAEAAAIQAGNQALSQRSTIDVNGKTTNLENLIPKENFIQVGNLTTLIGTVNTSLQTTAQSATTLNSSLQQVQGPTQLATGVTNANVALQGTVSLVDQLKASFGTSPLTLLSPENASIADQFSQKLGASNIELQNAVGFSEQLLATLNDLKNLGTIRVNIQQSGTRARWAGGPVTAGETYKVNELGKEGFLSRSGDFSMINRPQNAMWRAPNSGVVIPANIIRQMPVPEANVKPRTRKISSVSSGQDRFADKLGRYMGAIAVSKSTGELGQLANVQAQQALQIGKLSRAVQDLAEKDWNVNVKLRSNGGTAILEALSHRL